MNQDNYVSSSEVSLVDLATIFVRRIWLFTGVFVLIMACGVVYALVQDEQYEYVSLYQVADVGQDKAVEKPATAIAVLKSQKLPELKAVYKAEHEVRVPFDTNFSNPEDTRLIRVISEASRKSAEEVKVLHNELLSYLKARHENLLGDTRNSLDARLDAVRRTLDALKEAPDAGQAVAEVIQKQVELEGELARLGTSEMLVVARESAERVAPNRKLIVVLSIVLAFIFSVVAVYLIEFASIVRKTMRSQSQI